ncbi:hypothetical protein AVDCRST_MAG94-746 [uncultured Leptolyngbya sp.]|uniref:Uncharacterized protein n=1 Tax=uncultured Leptolyngbya sp. TaxID=332963 RepID=A0A6J4KIW4_9CYAN|nr:hypothetical protein AVDCRST_MAG94-746 [uncultured Leptolyngbya sp.]
MKFYFFVNSCLKSITLSATPKIFTMLHLKLDVSQIQNWWFFAH